MGSFGVVLLNERMRWSRFVGFVATISVFLLPGWVRAGDNVFILNSYHREKALSDDTIDTIITQLQSQHPELRFLIEDMDTKRNSIADLLPCLLKFYTEKYSGADLSAVVTVDNNAFDFAMEYRQQLFPGVPIVFCGVNGFQHSVLDGVEGVTGVAEAVELDATVKVALALHPGTTHLAVVSDTTPTGRELLGEFHRFADQLPKSLQIVELVGLTTADLLKRMKELPPRTVVLRFSFFRDADGKSFRVDEQAKLITQAGLPVFDFWDEGIGLGYEGGYVVTGESQGKVVAGMLERILAGEDPDQIAVVDQSPNIPVFDKRQLLRTGADLSQLPPNAVLRFDEPSFWVRHPRLTAGLGVTFLVLFGFAVFFAALSVQRKRYADALFREQQKLRATLQSIGEGVVTTNTHGKVDQFNSVAEQWIGLPIEQVRGRSVDEVFQLKDSSTDAVIELNPNGDFPSTGSGQLLTAHGKSLPIVLTAAPISLPQESASGSVIVFRDMTRENELQQELQQVRRLDALGQLAGGVAHDFNNMLGGIMGAAEILSVELEGDQLSEFPNLILNSANCAAGLTKQLLSFAREQSVSKEPVGIHRIINDTVDVLKRTIDPRIEIDVQTEAEMDIVEGDRALLQSCLLNLGVNASHAMPSGGKLVFATRDIRMTASDSEDNSFDLEPGCYIEVRVQDTGGGIAPDIIERIFEPFFTTKEQGKGTGLGLAAVFGTVQQHAGSVAVRSKLGIGTSFDIRLPITKQPTSSPRESDNVVAGGTGVVLVVEDEVSVRRIARRTLEGIGYEVLTASNGLEAVEIYRREQKRIGVVLLDMVMPKMSGRDCFVELQRINPDVRVVSTSGYYSQDHLQEMARLGMTTQLPKPYRCEELSSAIGNAIQAG